MTTTTTADDDTDDTTTASNTCNPTSQPQTHSQNSKLALEEEEEEEEDTLLFSCRCESAKAVSTLLSSLRHAYCMDKGNSNSESNSDNICTVFVTESAITFHVNGVARQSQASADMQASLFSEYYVWSEEITRMDEETKQQTQEILAGGEFCVNLTTVLECLNVLGTHTSKSSSSSQESSTKLCMSYDRQSCIFKLELEEHGVLSTCAILGSEPGDEHGDDQDNGGGTGIGAAFRRDKIVARAILKSDFLKDAVDELFELKANGASCCTLGISSDRIELGAVGHSGECLVYLPKTPEVFVSLECDSDDSSPNKLYTFSYPLNTFLQGMRGLDIAHETCLSVNSRGIIAIQHQVLDLVGSGQPNFIDFIMGALEEDLDQDEEQDMHDEDSESESLHQATAYAYNDGSLSSQQQNAGIGVAEAVKIVDSEQTTSELDIPQDRVSQSPSTDTDDDNDDEFVAPSLLVGKAMKRGTKRSSPARKSVSKVTLTHPSSHTHYSDSSEDEYEFN